MGLSTDIGKTDKDASGYKIEPSMLSSVVAFAKVLVPETKIGGKGRVRSTLLKQC
jgi:hypothetical protein